MTDPTLSERLTALAEGVLHSNRTGYTIPATLLLELAAQAKRLEEQLSWSQHERSVE